MKRFLLVAALAATGCAPRHLPADSPEFQAKVEARRAELRKAQAESERVQKLATLPPDAVVVREGDEWWVIEVDGTRYMAQWERKPQVANQWRLTYAGTARGAAPPGGGR